MNGELEGVRQLEKTRNKALGPSVENSGEN